MICHCVRSKGMWAGEPTSSTVMSSTEMNALKGQSHVLNLPCAPENIWLRCMLWNLSSEYGTTRTIYVDWVRSEKCFWSTGHVIHLTVLGNGRKSSSVLHNRLCVPVLCGAQILSSGSTNQNPSRKHIISEGLWVWRSDNEWRARTELNVIICNGNISQPSLHTTTRVQVTNLTLFPNCMFSPDCRGSTNIRTGERS